MIDHQNVGLLPPRVPHCPLSPRQMQVPGSIQMANSAQPQQKTGVRDETLAVTVAHLKASIECCNMLLIIQLIQTFSYEYSPIQP